ncbi:hypothetical protein [Blastococcus saxobsidens]|uniref:Uncharacterized protein n=1 Tax=Blastococcus saxobsidens TaxID=138336 RepID=A0A4Q7YD19_9ACTN|nr:hypothetical protein [Blastococcus saxobsidens]RZU34115.1 hypothetical protein BKA19_3870 [Blastococcus saxobsidens]
MSAMVVVGAVWLALAVGFALLLGSSIRLADARQTATNAARNFVVDGNPFAAPLPAPPSVDTAGAPALLLAPRTGRSVRQG